MTSLGAVLEQFPDEVIVYVTDPRTGIQRRSKWPPTISEVIEACEEHKEFLARSAKPRPAPPRISFDANWNERPAGSLANIFVPEDHIRYASLVEKIKTLDPVWWKFGNASDGRRGIFIPLNIWDGSGIVGASHG